MKDNNQESLSEVPEVSKTEDKYRRMAKRNGHEPTLEEKHKHRYKEQINRLRKTHRNVLMICSILLFLLVLLMAVMIIVPSISTGKLAGNDNTASGSKASKTASNSSSSKSAPSATDTPTPTPTATPTPTPAYAELCAVGDDLAHPGVYTTGERDDGTHDYSSIFADISEYMADCDIKVLNQETVFGGDDLGFSGYPVFNSPTELGHAAAAAGFNVITQATNHAYDMGFDGMMNTNNFWKENYPDVMALGINSDPSQVGEIPIMEVNGIKIAMLNYTYSHNWETVSSYAIGYLNFLCAYDPDDLYIDFNTINPQVIEDIKKAEELADFTIVFPHWGTEYVYTYTDQQTDFAKQMCEAGADLIIGTHPHVIEPVEWVEGDNGNRCLVYYSLGNFTSTQDLVGGLLGGVARLQICKDSTGTYIPEDSIKALGIVTQYVSPRWNIAGDILLKNYSEDLALEHGIWVRYGIPMHYDDLVERAQDAFGDYFAWE